MMNNKDIHSDLPIPPGEYLVEVISELGMTKDELAKRMNRPATKLSAIFTGEKAITPETALQLEKVVGVPAHIWTGLEDEYRLTVARIKQHQERQKLKSESKLVARFCYNNLVQLGLVERKTRAIDKVLELQHFFGVTSLENISQLRRYAPAFRQGGGKYHDNQSPEALATWLRIGELQAQNTVCPAFDKKKLENTLPLIRTLTRQLPERFEPVLQEFLAEAGVVFVLLPHLPKTYVHGATFWLGNQKAVLLLTIRGAWADIFWFSLFHELGHLLLHPSRKEVILEWDDTQSENRMREQQADDFAANTLIPEALYKEFTLKGKFYEEDIVRFAEQVGIDAGIVVGRLQHAGHIQNAWHNKLRTRYQWKKHSIRL